MNFNRKFIYKGPGKVDGHLSQILMQFVGPSTHQAPATRCYQPKYPNIFYSLSTLTQEILIVSMFVLGEGDTGLHIP